MLPLEISCNRAGYGAGRKEKAELQDDGLREFNGTAETLALVLNKSCASQSVPRYLARV